MQEAKMEEPYGSATETLSDRDTDLFGADKKELFLVCWECMWM